MSRTGPSRPHSVPLPKFDSVWLPVSRPSLTQVVLWTSLGVGIGVFCLLLLLVLSVGAIAIYGAN